MRSHFLYATLLGFLLVQLVSGFGGARNSNKTASRDDRALKSFLQRVSLGRALPCQTDADCGKRNNNRCISDDIKLCGRASVANLFRVADEKTCLTDADCRSIPGVKKLIYRCHAGQCDVCGPRICQTDADCCTSGQGEAQTCTILTGYTQKRCWKSCVKKEDCTATLGLANVKLTCIDSVCQKRSRKPKGQI